MWLLWCFKWFCYAMTRVMVFRLVWQSEWLLGCCMKLFWVIFRELFNFANMVSVVSGRRGEAMWLIGWCEQFLLCCLLVAKVFFASCYMFAQMINVVGGCQGVVNVFGDLLWQSKGLLGCCIVLFWLIFSKLLNFANMDQCCVWLLRCSELFLVGYYAVSRAMFSRVLLCSCYYSMNGWWCVLIQHQNRQLLMNSIQILVTKNKMLKGFTEIDQRFNLQILVGSNHQLEM